MLSKLSPTVSFFACAERLYPAYLLFDTDADDN